MEGGRAVGLDAARCASYFTLQNWPLPSAASCSRMYWRTCSNSNPTVDPVYPRALKGSPEKFLSFPEGRAMAIALCPFQNPITDATGASAAWRCTWALDGGPRAHVHRDPAETPSCVRDWILEREECDCYRTAFREGEEFLGGALLGPLLRGVHGRVRIRAGSPIHPRAGCRGW